MKKKTIKKKEEEFPWKNVLHKMSNQKSTILALYI